MASDIARLERAKNLVDSFISDPAQEPWWTMPGPLTALSLQAGPGFAIGTTTRRTLVRLVFPLSKLFAQSFLTTIA